MFQEQNIETKKGDSKISTEILFISVSGAKWSRFSKILQEFINKNNGSMPKILFDLSIKLAIEDIYFLK